MAQLPGETGDEPIIRKVVLVTVTVHIPQFLQHLTNGVTSVQANGGTVGDCLNDLVVDFPQLKELLFEKEGILHDYLDVFINRESAYPEELAQPVKDGDELNIVKIIVGG